MSGNERANLTQKLLDAHTREKLLALQDDPSLMIQATSFSPDSVKYPDGQIPFVDKHLAYLMRFPALDPDQYVANLRLMLKRR